MNHFVIYSNTTYRANTSEEIQSIELMLAQDGVYQLFVWSGDEFDPDCVQTNLKIFASKLDLSKN